MIEIDYGLLFGYDKRMHFLLFLTSSIILGGVIFSVTSPQYIKRNLICIWFSLLLIGSIEEYRQSFLVDRSAEFLDAVANLLGASVGIVVLLSLRSFFYKKHKNTPVSSTRYLFPFIILILLPIYFGLWKLNEEPFLFFTI